MESIAVDSAMFTLRAGVGRAEAQRAGANRARIEVLRFGSRPKQEVQRLGDAAVEKCIVIL